MASAVDMDGLVFTKHSIDSGGRSRLSGREATEPAGGQVGAAAELIGVYAGVPAQRGQ
ncbi:hypothetical protein KYY02_12370 [Streptomyces pimonensis]|uniref:Uncharacterized protein n=1 Tax=Streptomyces pimonensis TaxID=2860288 RepID=A0ABV4J1X6_9ACTN